jgi:hypothetical protein
MRSHAKKSPLSKRACKKEQLAGKLPGIPLQQQVVQAMRSERALVECNRKLIEIFEVKIKAKLDEIWGEPNGAT